MNCLSRTEPTEIILEEMMTNAVPSLKDLAAKVVTDAHQVPTITLPDDLLQYMVHMIDVDSLQERVTSLAFTHSFSADWFDMFCDLADPEQVQVAINNFEETFAACTSVRDELAYVNALVNKVTGDGEERWRDHYHGQIAVVDVQVVALMEKIRSGITEICEALSGPFWKFFGGCQAGLSR